MMYEKIMMVMLMVGEKMMMMLMPCGGAIQTSVQNMTDDVLGTCAQFEEMQIGGER